MAHPFNTPDLPDKTPKRALTLETPDVIAALRLMGEVASLRNDPRNWRMALLAGLNHFLPASASAAFILKKPTPGAPPVVVSLFDAGFKNEPHHQAFLSEFNTAPFRDPLALKALSHFATLAPEMSTFTALRADLVDDSLWSSSSHVKEFRTKAHLGDCAISLHRGSHRSFNMVLYVLKSLNDSARFTPRDRVFINTFHSCLDWIYRAEESTQRLNRASALSPRLRQTLECLLAGNTERQVAMKMALSVHTVHDYVKALYSHFGVSSRGELIARWIHTAGQPSQGPFSRG